MSTASSPALDIPPQQPARRLHPICRVSRARWVEALRRLEYGHRYRGQGSERALTNASGCILPVKAANRKVSGYIQCLPPVLVPAHEQEPIISPQLAHRVACYIYKSEADVEKLLYGGYHASHRCGYERCINPEHLVVETKAENEARKACSNKVDVITVIGQHRYVLHDQPCTHTPPCIIRREERNAVQA